MKLKPYKQNNGQDPLEDPILPLIRALALDSSDSDTFVCFFGVLLFTAPRLVRVPTVAGSQIGR